MRRGWVNSNSQNSFKSYSSNKYKPNKVSENTFSRLNSINNGGYATSTFPTVYPTLEENLNENSYYNYYGDNECDCDNEGCYCADESGEVIFIERDTSLDVSCNTDEFACDPQAHEKICIKQNLVCDGIKQCSNGRDESSCGRNNFENL